jgi:hypothetical protein
VSDPAEAELSAQLRAANERIAELETARLRAETLFAVTQVMGKTLSLQDTFETILGQLQRVVPYDSSSVQVIQAGLQQGNRGRLPRRRGCARRSGRRLGPNAASVAEPALQRGEVHRAG